MTGNINSLTDGFSTVWVETCNLIEFILTFLQEHVYVKKRKDQIKELNYTFVDQVLKLRNKIIVYVNTSNWSRLNITKLDHTYQFPVFIIIITITVLF